MDLGAVVKRFVGVVHLADSVYESIESGNIFGLDIVLFENALVGKNRANIDEPRYGVNRRVGIDMGRVPTYRDKSCGINRGKPGVQSLDFTTGCKIRDPGGAQLENVRGVFAGSERC